MGGLFDGGTKQVTQQPTQTALPASEVDRISGITGQQTDQQKALSLKRRGQAKTVLGSPIQPVGNTNPGTFGSY